MTDNLFEGSTSQNIEHSSSLREAIAAYSIFVFAAVLSIPATLLAVELVPLLVTYNNALPGIFRNSVVFGIGMSDPLFLSVPGSVLVGLMALYTIVILLSFAFSTSVRLWIGRSRQRGKTAEDTYLG